MSLAAPSAEKLISHIPAIWPNLTPQQRAQKENDIRKQYNADRQMKLFGENEARD
jgi:hypothetical protein